MVSTKILNPAYDHGTNIKLPSEPESRAEDGQNNDNDSNNNPRYTMSIIPRNNVISSRSSRRHRSTRRANQIAKANISMTPPGTTEALVENMDRAPGAYAVGPTACAGTYEGKHVPTVGLFAKASTGDTQAHVGPMHAKANGPTAGAGVHASPLGVGVFANAEVGRVEASLGGVTAGLGLNFNTGASIGVDGVSVSALGFGVSLGRHIAVRTPVADASCSIL
ncbi:unnamed protein product [Orchesella dallaii]|uniref:Uncharacterized protein n=1 Tax=Orchesella dallaii TaxID=48710 RepID=A0ABP1PWH1_9HEXA